MLSRLNYIFGVSSSPPPPEKVDIKIPWFRRVLGPLLLMVVTPPVAIGVWIIVAHYQGSIVNFMSAGWHEWSAYIPRPSLYALSLISIFALAQGALLLVLPGKKDYGPLTSKGNRPLYKFNGILAWGVTHVLLFGLAYPLGLLDPVKIYQSYGSILVTLNIIALIFCVFLYVKGRFFPSSTDAVLTGNFFFDFFQGIELYPTIAGVSWKQLINCRFSMMGWSVVFILCLLVQWEIYGEVSNSMIASVVILVLYLFKFFLWERGYLFSMDIIHDRFGYYICWGVLVWVPSIYCLVALYLVEHPHNYSPTIFTLILLLGVVSIWINYDADRQRRQVRDVGGKTKVWGKEPVIIKAQYLVNNQNNQGGQKYENLLLASGWWGISRHFHYIPELTLALAWTLPVGFNHLLPWFYLVFLFILLMDRAERDDKKCSLKYGAYWEEYRKKVPYKVWPFIY